MLQVGHKSIIKISCCIVAARISGWFTNCHLFFFRLTKMLRLVSRRMISGVSLNGRACRHMRQGGCLFLSHVSPGSRMEVSPADKQKSRLHHKSGAEASPSCIIRVNDPFSDFRWMLAGCQGREPAHPSPLPWGFSGHRRRRRQQRGLQFEIRQRGS